jgi:hypothetical protein
VRVQPELQDLDAHSMPQNGPIQTVAGDTQRSSPSARLWSSPIDLHIAHDPKLPAKRLTHVPVVAVVLLAIAAGTGLV